MAVACSGGDGGGGFGALVDYAVGDWSCGLTIEGLTADVDATVKADSATSGTFEFVIEDFGMPPSTGEWRLAGRSLEMDVTEVSRYTAEGVALDTDGIEILEQAPGSDLQEVGIDRSGTTVTFSWDDPWTGDPVDMECAKG
jgi:hypothetical protein